MWNKKSKNIFTLDFNIMKQSKKFIYLPNLNDDMVTYQIKRYNMIKNSNNEIKTIHAHNLHSKAIITEYENYITVFVLDINGNYSIKIKKNNIYEIKSCCKKKNQFSCNTIRADGQSNDCGCDFMESRPDKIPVAKETASMTTTDFTFGDIVRQYDLVFGLTSAFKEIYGNNVSDIWNRLVHIINIINLIYQNNFSCYFLLNQTHQEAIINSTTFDNVTKENITDFTGKFNSVLSSFGGSSVYDIGHVLSTGSGGLAYLNSLCSTNKGDAWTSEDVTDDQQFIVDYLCHELGHQFGCNHIHQNCNATTTSNFEPGSGSTIMSYAGICSPNIQGDSDPYFNRYNIWEAKQHIESTSCGVETNSNKPIPTINNVYDSNIKYIPEDVSFELYADNITNTNTANNLLYTWEGIDLGSKAIFRSKMLDTSYRTFSNTDSWDKLPVPVEKLAFNIAQIKLYNGYTSSTGGKWTGTFTITHTVSITDNTSTTTDVNFDFSGIASSSITLNIEPILYNPTSISTNVSFVPIGGTWASDLLVVLTNSDSQDILQWGGYNLSNNAPVNSIGWDGTLQNTDSATYNQVITLDTISSNSYSFQLTVRASYNL